MIKDSTTTGSIAIADKPLGTDEKRKRREFVVSAELFNRFQTGRTKFERWSKYLNLQDEVDKEIFDFYSSNRGATIILRNEDNGALRAIRQRAANE
jgi:hypothetical protein